MFFFKDPWQEEFHSKTLIYTQDLECFLFK